MRVLRVLLLIPTILTVLPARGQVEIKNPAKLSPAVTRYVKVPAAEWIVLKNVRVIDGTGAPAIEKTDVVIHNGKIDSIGTGEKIAPDEIVLDLSGRTVFPGLVGMHDHMYNIARPNLAAEGHSEPPLMVPELAFSSTHLYLGAGVTTLRTTGSVEPYTDLNVRDAIDAGEIPGPHMDVTGPYLEGSKSVFIQMHKLRDAEDAKRDGGLLGEAGCDQLQGVYVHHARGVEGGDRRSA